MPKGYWIARVDVRDPVEFQKYADATAEALRKHGGVALARGGRTEIMEGTGYARNVIWEFPSLQAAVDCFNSPEYQRAREYRLPVATGDFVMVEGC